MKQRHFDGQIALAGEEIGESERKTGIISARPSSTPCARGSMNSASCRKERLIRARRKRVPVRVMFVLDVAHLPARATKAFHETLGLATATVHKDALCGTERADRLLGGRGARRAKNPGSRTSHVPSSPNGRPHCRGARPRAHRGSTGLAPSG